MVVGEGALAGEHLIHLGLDGELLEDPYLVADLRCRLGRRLGHVELAEVERGRVADLLGAIEVALAKRLRRLPLRPLGALEASSVTTSGSSVRPAA